MIVSEKPSIDLINGDCMDYMATLPDNAFELAIVDPPYGIGVAKMAYTQEENRPCRQKNGKTLRVKKKKHAIRGWDSETVGDEYLKELVRVSKNQIIWGINYMNFHLRGGRIVWNKMVAEGISFSDCEIAYVSNHERVELVNFKWAGMMQGVYCGKDIFKASIQQGNKKLNEERIHPTQKPVALYRWLLHNYAKQGDRILDTHLGSGSSAIACHGMGFDMVGIELDADYYAASIKRFKEQTAQVSMFG